MLLALVLFFSTAAGAGPVGKREARIQNAWKQLHPDKPLPVACAHPAPVSVLEVDVDETPGMETVLASLRYGVFLLPADKSAPPLASMELSCDDARYWDYPGSPSRIDTLKAVRASGLAPADVLLRHVFNTRCGNFGMLYLLRRRERILEPLFELNDFQERECGADPQVKERARLDVLAVGKLRVTIEGSSAEWLIEEARFAPPQRYL